MITFTAMLVGLVIFAMLSDVYNFWISKNEIMKWKKLLAQKEQELKRCKMEQKAILSRRI